MDNNEKQMPQVESGMIKKAIIRKWDECMRDENSNFDEVTYRIFDDLYRLNESNANFMWVTYKTLIDLNKKMKNISMVEHLEGKCLEYYKNIYGDRSDVEYFLKDYENSIKSKEGSKLHQKKKRTT